MDLYQKAKIALMLEQVVEIKIIRSSRTLYKTVYHHYLGVKHGRQEIYYDGELFSVAHYNMGEKHGEFKVFEFGIEVQYIWYKNDEFWKMIQGDEDDIERLRRGND